MLLSVNVLANVTEATYASAFTDSASVDDSGVDQFTGMQ